MKVVSEKQENDIIAETKYLVEYYLNTNKSDVEISKATGISSSTVGRRLTNKKRILEAFPEDGLKKYNEVAERRKANLARAKIIGGQTSRLNNTIVNGKSKDFSGTVKLSLDILHQNQEQQWKFLMHIALCFRLKLGSLANLFHLDEKLIIKKFLGLKGGVYNSLLYLFYQDVTDQQIAIEKFLNYYKELLTAIKNKDIEQENNLKKQVTDYSVSEFIKEFETSKTLTDDNIEVLLNYQLKYALTFDNMINRFNLNGMEYQNKVMQFISDKPYLKERLDALIDYASKQKPENKRG